MAEINNLEDIKTNFEQITNLINSMRAQGVLSFSGVDKILTAINTKLDNINLDENADLIKLLINEVKTNIEERHGFVVSKFAEIETAVNTLVADSENSVKAPEIKKLFDVIATNLAVFSKEVISQKDALAEITLRLESLRTDDTDKKDIIGSISTVKFDIARINNGFESIILNINNNFQELSKSFEKLTEANLNDKYGKSIDDIHTTSNTILSAIQMLDRKNAELNEGLDRLITVGDFKEAKEVLLDLVTKHDDMQTAIAETADRDTVNNLSGIIATSVNAINDLRTVLTDSADEKSKQIVSRLDNLEDIVKSSTEKFDFRQLKSELHSIINEIGNETNIICNDLLDTNNDLKQILTAVNISDFNTNLTKINTTIANNELNIREAISQSTNKVLTENRDSINSFVENFNFQIGELNSKFEVLKNEFLSIDSENFDNVINYINQISELTNGLNSKIDSANSRTIDVFNTSLQELKNNFETLTTNINGASKEASEELIEKLNGIFSTTSDLKTELMVIEENNTQKITSSLYSLSELVNSLSSNINNIPFDYPEQINEKLAGLNSQLSNLSNNINNLQAVNSNKFAEGINELYTKLNSLSDDLRSVYAFDSETLKNNISDLYNKINEFNSELPELLFQTGDRLNANIASIQTQVNHTHNLIETIENKLDNNDINKTTLDKIDAIDADIKFIIENLTATVSESNNMLYDRIGELNNDLKNLSGALFENIGSNQADLNNKLNTILTTIETVKTEFNNIPQNNNINTDFIQEKFNALSDEIKFVRNELSNTNNDNNSILLEKFDNISNNAFELKSIILSNLNGINLDITEKIDRASINIKDNISDITSNIEEHTGIITNKLDIVSNDVKNVTDKLANYFINNDSDINTKLNDISNQINISGNNISEKFESIKAENNENIQKISELEQKLSDKADIISSKLSTSSDILSEKIDTVSADVKGITTEIVNHFLKENDDSSIQNENLNKNIDYTRGQIIERLESKSDEVKSNLNDIKQNINSLHEHFEESQKNHENTEILIQKLDNITADVKGLTNELINQISQDEDEKNTKFQIINNSINYTKQELSEQIIQKHEQINNSFSEINDLITNVPSQINERINQEQNKLNTQYEHLNNSIINIKEEINEQIIEEHKILDNKYSEVTENIANIKEDINTQINLNTTSLNSLINNFDSTKSELIENNNINYKDLKESINSTIHSSQYELDQHLSSLNEKVNSSKEEILNNLQTLSVNESIEAIKYEVKSLDEKFEQTSQDFATQNTEKIQNIHTNINLSKDEILNNLSTLNNENTSKLVEQVITSENAMKEAFTNHLETSNKDIIETVNHIISAIDSKDEFLNDKTTEIISRMKDTLTTFQANVEFSNRVLIDTTKGENINIKSSIETLASVVKELEDEVKSIASNNKFELLDNINSVKTLISNLTDEYKTILEDKITELGYKIYSIPQKLEASEQIILQKIEETNVSKEEQVSELTDKINDIKYSLAEKTDNIQETLDFKLDNLKTDLKQVISIENSSSKIRLDDISENIKDLTTILTEYSESIQNKDTEKIQVINSNIEELKQELSRIETTAISLNENNKNEHSEKLENIIESIKNLFSSISESDNAILQKFDTELNSIKASIQSLVFTTTENKETICELIASKIETLENILSKIDSKQEANKVAIYEQLIDSIDNIRRITEDTDLKLGESVSKMQEIQDKSIAILTDTQNSLNNKLIEIKDTETNQYIELGNNIERLKSILISRADWDDRFNDIEGALINLSRDLGNLSNQALREEDLESIRFEIENIQNNLKSSFAEESNNKYELILSELTKTFDNIYDTINNNLNQQEQNIHEMFVTVTGNIDNTVHNINNLVEKIEDIKSIITSDSSSENIIEKLNEFKQEFEAINNNVRLISEENTNELNNKLVELTQSLNDMEERVRTTSFNDNKHISALIDKLSTSLNDVETKVNEELHEKTDNIATLIKDVADSIKVLDENIDEDTTRQLTIIQEELTSISSALFTNTDKLNLASKIHFDEVSEKFDYVVNLINDVKTEFCQISNSNIEKISSEFKNINRLFEESETIKTKLSSLETNLKDNCDNIIEKIKEFSSQELVENCINKVEAVEHKIDKLDFASQNSEEADKIIISNIELLEHKLETIGNNIDSISRNTISEEVSEIKNIINKQQEQLKLLSSTEDLQQLPTIEDINSSLSNNIADLLDKFNKKLDETSTKEILAEQLSILKSDILSQTVKILDQISFEIEQAEIMDYVQENANNVKLSVNNLKEELLTRITLNKEELLDTLANKNDLASEFDYINKKLDDLSDNYELQKGFEEVKSKLDSVTDNTIIKEFSEVKSQLETVANNNELQKEFEEVKKHLLSIQSGDSDADYAYSLQDVESDIAKLRIAMKELQDVTPDEELEDIAKKVDDIVLVVDSIKNQITQAEIDEIGANVEKMNDDIVSISSRTNKLILTSENSANLLKENLDNFKLVIDDLDERTRSLAESNDLSNVHESISSIEKTLKANEEHTNVVNQSLIAIAEWVDCAGGTLATISDKIEKLNDIDDVKAMVRSIELPSIDYSVFDSIEEKFNAQQDRIDNLEDKLNRLMELVEANDNTQITKKITSVDKQLAKLNKSIERLTSYVDEE